LHRAARAGSATGECPLPNRMAITLGALIAVAMIADQIANDGQAGLFVMRKFVGLLEYLAFWR
jgi:hypothetical protein